MAHVSTAELPPPDLVAALVAEAHDRCRATEPVKSRVYPALERVPADLFGVCMVGTGGRVYAAGYAEVEFTITSIALSGAGKAATTDAVSRATARLFPERDRHRFRRQAQIVACQRDRRAALQQLR